MGEFCVIATEERSWLAAHPDYPPYSQLATDHGQLVLGDTTSATVKVLFSSAVARLFGIITLALAYVQLHRAGSGADGQTRIGRFSGSRATLHGAFEVSVCLRWMEQT